MSRRDKKKEDPPKDLHSGKHLEKIKITIEIEPEIVVRGKMVNVFYYGMIDGRRHWLGGAGCYWKEDSTAEDQKLDEPKTLRHFERAREYITKYISDAMDHAAEGLIREATEMHGAPHEVIDEQTNSSLDLNAERDEITERGRLVEKMFKELTDSGMTREDAIKEQHERVSALGPLKLTWFQDLVCRYAARVAMRLNGHAFWWVDRKKRWRVGDSMLERFRFFEVHEIWKLARSIHSALPARTTFEEKKKAVEAACGPLPDDLLAALFEWPDGASDYKWRPVKVAAVHAARKLHFDAATMEQAESLYEFFRNRPLYERPPQEVLDKMDEDRERRWQLKWERCKK
jgi:hypothetical protein